MDFKLKGSESGLVKHDESNDTNTNAATPRPLPLGSTYADLLELLAYAISPHRAVTISVLLIDTR